MTTIAFKVIFFTGYYSHPIATRDTFIDPELPCLTSVLHRIIIIITSLGITTRWFFEYIQSIFKKTDLLGVKKNDLD